MTFKAPQPLDAADLGAKLARAYADAVLAFLRSGDPQGIDYDPGAMDFDIDAVEPGTSPTDVGLWVDERWQERVGELGMTTDRRHREFSELALRKAIVDRLDSDPLLRKLALSVAADRVATEIDQLNSESARKH